MSLLDNITGLFDVSAESKKANEAWVDNAISATDYLSAVLSTQLLLVDAQQVRS